MQQDPITLAYKRKRNKVMDASESYSSAYKKTQWVKMTAAKPDNLSSVPSNSQDGRWDPTSESCPPIPQHTHIHRILKSFKYYLYPQNDQVPLLHESLTCWNIQTYPCQQEDFTLQPLKPTSRKQVCVPLRNYHSAFHFHNDDKNHWGPRNSFKNFNVTCEIPKE